MIAIPSESYNEKDVILRIKEEMKKVEFDQIEIEPMGNILGYLGQGKHLIGFGPGHENQLHAPNESVWKGELVKAAALYVAIPVIYLNNYLK